MAQCQVFGMLRLLIGQGKEKQTKKKWYATQIKRLAICMADLSI